MKGYEDLIDRTRGLLTLSQDADANSVEVLEKRVDLLERTVYYLLQRLRDEGAFERRTSNKLDIDMAVFQSGLRSSLEATDARYDAQRKGETPKETVRASQ